MKWKDILTGTEFQIGSEKYTVTKRVADHVRCLKQSSGKLTVVGKDTIMRALANEGVSSEDK